jgi:hypothetical protein
VSSAALIASAASFHVRCFPQVTRKTRTWKKNRHTHIFPKQIQGVGIAAQAFP